jgi:hypothetical protein
MSTGRKRKVPEPGTQFGSWLVLGPAVVSTGTPQTYVLCRCKCGKEYVRNASSLRRGKSKSCHKCSCSTRRTPRSRFTERNAAIMADTRAGMHDKQIAAKYGISRQRVYQIQQRLTVTVTVTEKTITSLDKPFSPEYDRGRQVSHLDLLSKTED